MPQNHGTFRFLKTTEPFGPSSPLRHPLIHPVALRDELRCSHRKNLSAPKIRLVLYTQIAKKFGPSNFSLLMKYQSNQLIFVVLKAIVGCLFSRFWWLKWLKVLDLLSITGLSTTPGDFCHWKKSLFPTYLQPQISDISRRFQPDFQARVHPPCFVVFLMLQHLKSSILHQMFPLIRLLVVP